MSITEKMLECCNACPHRCKVNRLTGNFGRCRAGKDIKIDLYSLHKFEEPCISGENGSGTVFFSNCNLSCVFCQNYEISQCDKGREISVQELSDIFLTQQENGAENINLVTPTIYAYQIIEAIKLARKKGLKLPIIYNSNGYENIETIKMLDGYIDVYLPDLKYYSNEIGKKYSKIDNYFEVASKAVTEMYNQVGSPIFDENGMIKKGLIIRHLILPNNLENTKNVLNWIDKNINKNVYVSLMAQYFPTYKSNEYDEISRKLTQEEYDEIEQYLFSLDIQNGYMQDLEENEEQYVPKF